MQTPKTLLIVDGFNILYRAFHGNEKLTGPNGQPTGALYGFMRTLGSIQRLFPDCETVITLDSFPVDHSQTNALTTVKPRIQQLADLGDSGPSRKDILPTYKSTRSAMPEDLQKQLLPLVFILQAHGFPILQGNSYAEADDLLATLATLAIARGITVVAASGDKDIMALIKDGECKLFNPNTNKVMEEKDVFEKFGVFPDKMEDFLALMGDAVDNIPGVRKCGEKTAAKWLTQFGDMSGVIANAHSVKGVVGDNLREALPFLPISKSLTSLKKDLPIDYDAATRSQPMDVVLLTTLYTQLGMKSALSKLNALNTGPTP